MLGWWNYWLLTLNWKFIKISWLNDLEDLRSWKLAKGWRKLVSRDLMQRFSKFWFFGSKWQLKVRKNVKNVFFLILICHFGPKNQNFENRCIKSLDNHFLHLFADFHLPKSSRSFKQLNFQFKVKSRNSIITAPHPLLMKNIHLWRWNLRGELATVAPDRTIVFEWHWN